MAMHDFISEHEACSVTGMTPRTLQRFAEAGYLSVEIEHDGLRLYSKRQLGSVFGGPVAQALGENPHPLDEADETKQDEDVIPPVSVDAEIASIFTGQEPVSTPRVAVETPVAEAEIATETVRSGKAAGNETGKPDLAPEVARLQNLLTMQEKILDHKDSEIGELRRERDWLRARIERLEEKSNRDQLLLLSETQTIRRLIVMSESRKSTFRQMLEWCGLSKETNTNHDRVVDMPLAVVDNGNGARPMEGKRASNG